MSCRIAVRVCRACGISDARDPAREWDVKWAAADICADCATLSIVPLASHDSEEEMCLRMAGMIRVVGMWRKSGVQLQLLR